MSVPTPQERINKAVRLIVEARRGEAMPALHAELLSMVERPLLAEVLRDVGGNLTHAAWRLGINRNTLRTKMRALKVMP